MCVTFSVTSVTTLFATKEERKRIRERQAQGIAVKRLSGSWDDYGRPSKLIPDFENYLQKQKDGHISVANACKELGISKSTWYNRVREMKV